MLQLSGAHFPVDRVDAGRVDPNEDLARHGPGPRGVFVLEDLGAAMPLGIVCYFTVLLCFERMAFPDDFSVARAVTDHIRSRLAGAPAPGEVA